MIGTGPERSRWTVVASLLARFLFAVLLALCLLEEGLRLLLPREGFRAARELTHFRDRRELNDLYTVDSELGFRPVLGTALYNAYGALVNDYPIEKRPGVTRLLFLGDSVTARGGIIDGLRRIYGDTKYEYWNAGVESFNTGQEVAFYKRYNAALRPDRVILTFHLNDFETTPVAFVSHERLVVYAPNFPATELSPWLFTHSMIYRLVIGWVRFSEQKLDAIVDETERSLADLKATLARERIPLTVVVLPIMAPYKQWSAADKLSREQILGILRRLKIRTIDLRPALDEAVAKGITLRESLLDSWHPSPELAEAFARRLSDMRLLNGDGPE